jgi:hypothetical protein
MKTAFEDSLRPIRRLTHRADTRRTHKHHRRQPPHRPRGLLTIRTKSYAKDSKSFLDKSLQEPPDSGVRLERTLIWRQEIRCGHVRIESPFALLDTCRPGSQSSS